MIGWVLSPVGMAWLIVVGVAVIWSRLRYGSRVGLVILVAGLGTLMGVYAVASVPLPKNVELPNAARVYDRNGRLIGTYSEVRRFIIDTGSLPRHVREAVITAEDRDFFDHGGISLKSIARAAWVNISSLGIRQGGSTISQQYVKNALVVDSSRTPVRKVKEMVLAIKLEDRFSKEQILGFYLNTIYFGRGAYGIEAAARTYFDKHAKALTLPEATFLAGIIRGPGLYQPDEHPARARARRDHVLEALHEEGYISAGQVDRAMRVPLRATPGVDERAREQKAAYFMEWVRKRYLFPRLGRCLYQCGLKIHTTLDSRLQAYAEKAVKGALWEKGDPEAALVSLTNRGEVRAFVGGRAVDDAVAATGFNFASDFPGRHAGSALKPFTLLAALEEGLSPYTAFSGGSPVKIGDRCSSGKKPWKVRNFGGASHGWLSLDQATALSVNTVYARLIDRVGPKAVANLLTDLGFARTGSSAEREIAPHCSLALGALDVTPVEMARAYAVLAAGGSLPAVVPISYVEDSQGECILSFVPQRECKDSVVRTPSKVASQTAVDAVTQVLSHVVDWGTGESAAIEIPASGKTGTSERHTDAWFSGYVPRLATSVWVGYPAENGGRLVPQMRHCSNRDKCRPVRGQDVTGGSLPALIWRDFMTKVVADWSGRGSDPASQGPMSGSHSGPLSDDDPRPTQGPPPEPKSSPAPPQRPEMPREPEPTPSPRRSTPPIILPTPLPTP